MEQINRLWYEKASEDKNYVRPRVLLASYQGHLYATASDHRSISFFVSPRGKVYAIPTRKLKIGTTSGGQHIYIIEDPKSFRVVSCGTPFTDVDRFVADKITPYLHELR